MRGPEPRAPEPEIPRPQGAGVGAPFPDLLREALDGALRALERAAGELEWAVELLADGEARAAELHVRAAGSKLAEVFDLLTAARVELAAGGGG